MDFLTAGLTILGTGFSYNAMEEEKEFREEMSAREAEIARGKAEFSVKQVEKDTRRLLSSQRMQYAKGGVTQEGTPQIVKATSMEQAQLEAMAIIWGGEVGADTAFMEGRIASAASDANQVSTILTGLSSLGRQYRTPS